MHDKNDDADASRSLASIRTMDIVVALLLLVGSSIVIMDSIRLGFGWRDDGPAPGFFPFWVAVLLGGSSLVNLAAALARQKAEARSFVTATALRRILAVLVPTLVYIAAIGGIRVGGLQLPGLGIYVASALFIAGFMIFIGRNSPLKAAAVGAAVSLVMFLMFEKWFLVPLPKGPVEALLGLG